jgi:hypothetical protein
MREPITCVGEDCGKIIAKPRFRQKFCSELCRLPLATRERRLQRISENEARCWAARREGDELLRTKMLPCPFCGNVCTAKHFVDDGGPSKTHFHCFGCFGFMEIQGTASEALDVWNARHVTTIGTK